MKNIILIIDKKKYIWHMSYPIVMANTIIQLVVTI